MDQNVGKGTLCYLKTVNIKAGCRPYVWKYNGYRVNCIRAKDVESILLYKEKSTTHIVTIKPVKQTVNIQFRKGETVEEVYFTQQKMLQLDVLSGIACTGYIDYKVKQRKH